MNKCSATPRPPRPAYACTRMTRSATEISGRVCIRAPKFMSTVRDRQIGHACICMWACLLFTRPKVWRAIHTPRPARRFPRSKHFARITSKTGLVSDTCIHPTQSFLFIGCACRCIWSTRRAAAAYAGTDIRPELLQRVGDKRRAAQEGNNGGIDWLQLRSSAAVQQNSSTAAAALANTVAL